MLNRVAMLELDQANAMLDWILRQRDKGILRPEKIGGTPTQRYAGWWGVGVDKTPGLLEWSRWSACRGWTMSPGLRGLAEKYAPKDADCNSILIYLYSPGVGIAAHSDKPIYAGTVSMIHLCRDDRPRQADLLGTTQIDTGRDSTVFQYGTDLDDVTLAHGEVVQFDARQPHGVPKLPVGVIRATIQFRHVNADRALEDLPPHPDYCAGFAAIG